MKSIKFIAMSAILSLSACSAPQEDAKIIDRPDFKSATGIFDSEALLSLGRVSDLAVSPDGKKVLYGVTYESVEENASNRDLYVKDIAGGDSVRITRTPKSENNALWIDGGNKIAFLYPGEDGAPQMWVMNADGSNRVQVTKVESGLNGFLLSPDEKKVVLIGNVKYAQSAGDIYPDLPKATGRVVDDLMYKHWDEWVTEIPHPFLGDFTGTAVENIIDIMEGEPYESPAKPFGGIESFAFSPDSKKLVYTSRKKKGVEYSLSTNTDLYLYDIEAKTTVNLTEGMMGYDTCPQFSPDGSCLAWLSMEHDGYESDKNRLFVLNFATGEKTDLTADWDYTIYEFAWNPNGRSLWFIAPYQGVIPVFAIDAATHEVTKAADGDCDYVALAAVDENTFLATRQSMVRPNEIFRVANGDVQPLTDVNGSVFAQVTMPTFEKRMIPATDGKEIFTWVLLPPNFDASKKYPSIFFCQGGPQSPVSQAWSYRWNFSLMASHGYVVILPNRRGLPGFGTEWNAQISGDYTGQNMRDYLSAADYMKKEPYIDPDRMGATGASYGGYSIYYLAGIHENRFACLLAHAGIFNTEAQYLETEEMWFANWDMGGAYWEKENPTFLRSPHRLVDKWNTPIMISHGELDYRILASQGMMAFNAAKLRGIPAEMVIFPDENHWILKPQNAVLWQRLFFRWFDKWLLTD